MMNIYTLANLGGFSPKRIREKEYLNEIHNSFGITNPQEKIP